MPHFFALKSVTPRTAFYSTLIPNYFTGSVERANGSKH